MESGDERTDHSSSSRGQQQQPSAPPQQGQKQGQKPSYQQPRQAPQEGYQRGPMFTSEQMEKILGMAVGLGLILLFLGALLVSIAGYIENDADLIRNLLATGRLLGSFGLLSIAGVASYSYLQGKDLSEHQEKIIAYMIVAATIGFSLILTIGSISVVGVFG